MSREKDSVGPIRLLTVNDVYCDHAVNGEGGYANLSTMLKKYREENENNVFCVIGDILGGSALTAFFQGKWVVSVLENMDTDFVCIGNHEFDYGAEVLEEIVSNSSMKWFGGNIRHTSDGSIMNGVLSTHVKEFSLPANSHGHTEIVKVGFLGVCTEYTPKLSFPGPTVEFQPVIACVEEQVNQLRNVEKVDVVVALTHVSLKEDIEIAKNVKGINVILGGHDHEPHMFFQGRTLIFKAGVSAFWLGMVDLEVSVTYDEDQKRTVKVHHSWAMKANIGYEPDPIITEIINKQIEKKTEMEKAENPEEVLIPKLECDVITKSTFCRMHESAMGNMIADGFRFTAGADMGMINGGFIRGDKHYKAGQPFTKGDVLLELPFPRPVCSLECTGIQLKTIIEGHLSLLPAVTSRFPHVSSNVHLRFDKSLEAGERIVEFTINSDNVLDNPNKIFMLAVTEFLANGGDNIEIYLETKKISTYSKVSSELCVFLRSFLKNNTYYKTVVEKRVCDVSEV